MKPTHERNQECLPPKKRDLLVNNATSTSSSTTTNSSSGSNAGGTGVGSSGGGGEEATSQSSGTSAEPHAGSGEWVRTQPSLHYGVEGPESIASVPIDQYGMLYKVALPSVTYASTSLHPVLSHISPAYTVPSPLLQHASIPYPPLGYAPIPHSSLQFVSPPYAAAVPYAVPPGFLPSSLISTQSGIPQSHLVPYQSVIQEGVVSSGPQQQVAAHAYAKVAAPGGVPLVLASEQAATQQQMGAVGMIPTAELSPRGIPIFYHPSASDRAVLPQRDAHGSSLEQEREVNGGDRENGGRDFQKEIVYMARNPQQGVTPEQDRKSSKQEGRASPGQRSTPDMDLEVQQVVGRLASPVHGVNRREAAHGLFQSPQTSREVQGDERTAYILQNASQLDPRPPHHPPQTAQPGQTVILPNGQPAFMPLDYHPQQQQHLQQHYYPEQSNNNAASENPKTLDPSSIQERVMALELPTATAVSPPSHFTKGAIIQLATGELKRVEDLQTQDFVRSAEASAGLKIDSSMVVDIRASPQRLGLVALRFAVGERQSKVSIDVPPEHPFFVFGQGWSSCSPEHTAQLYGLTCHHLQVGDVCVSITLQQHSTPHHKPPLLSQQPQQQHPSHSRFSTKANSTPGASSQPMGPPAPQHPRPQLRMERVQRERERERVDKDEPMKLGATGQGETPSRPDRTSAEHTRSQSSYYLHSEGHSPSQRRWSTPGFQRYSLKREEGGLVTTPISRPSFIPQEVKLSIEGRSNAGK